MRHVLFIITFAVLCTFPYDAYAVRDTVVEVTKEEELKILKALLDEAHRILQDRKTCKETAQDYKQECLCNKRDDYLKLELMIESAVPPERGLWFDNRLRYEENGQTAFTSMQYFRDINQIVNESCLPNGDGTYRANHEWDKPELTIENNEDMLKLKKFEDDIQKLFYKESECWQRGDHTREECACTYKPNLMNMGSMIKSYIQKNPEWYKHVLVFRLEPDLFRISLERYVRQIREKIALCKR